MSENTSNLLAVDILIDGKVQKKYAHEGKTYIASKIGEKYAIRLKNNSSRRILCVGSVDGLSVIDGLQADLSGPGYILGGYSSYTIPGFRVSNDKVNAFEFAKKEESYAAKAEDNKQGAINCGVIGIAAYSEKVKDVIRKWAKLQNDYYDHYKPSAPWPHYPPYIPHKTDDFPRLYDVIWSAYPHDMTWSSCSVTEVKSSEPEVLIRSASLFDTGTKFSQEEIKDVVTDGVFERDKIIFESDIYYASREALEAMGIKLTKEPEINYPESFPGRKFCKPPKI